MNIPTELIENFCVPAKEEGTAAMKSVWLDVENSRLLATDGHMAMRLSIGVSADDISGLVPVEVFDLSRKELKLITKAQGKEVIPDPWLSVLCGADVVIIENLLTRTKHLVERPGLRAGEKFPSMDRVFPALTCAPSTTFDPAKIKRIVSSLDGLSMAVSVWVKDGESAIALASSSGKGCAVLMPMRYSVDFAEVNARGAVKEEVLAQCAD